MAVVLICGMCPRRNTCILPKSILYSSRFTQYSNIQRRLPNTRETDILLCVDLPRHRDHRPNRNVLYQSVHRPPVSPLVSPAWFGALTYLVEVGTFLNPFLGPIQTLRRWTCMFARAEKFRSPRFHSNPEMPLLVFMEIGALIPTPTLASGSSSTGTSSMRSPSSSPLRQNASAKLRKQQKERNALINMPYSSVLASSML